VDLIEQVAQRGLWDGELADWILTAESRSACRATAEHGVGIAMYDGFSFKRIGWGAGIVPTGLPPDFRARAKTQVRPVFDESLALNEVLSVAFDVCSDLYPSGLVSQDFDFGTHRPGHQLSIERLRVPGRRRSPKSASFSV
jgi:hypothetical protein